MALDLESELRAYGDVLDEAAEATPRPPRRHRAPSTVTAAAALLVITSAVLLARSPAQAPSAPSAIPTTGYEPDQFAEIIVDPDTVVSYGLTAAVQRELDLAEALGAPTTGQPFWCTGWSETADGEVSCQTIERDPYRYAALYLSHEHGHLAIAYANEALALESYASAYIAFDARSRDMVAEEIDVAGTTGVLLESIDDPPSLRVVAWSPSPSTTVLLEAVGLTWRNLLELADAVVPVTAGDLDAELSSSGIPLQLAMLDDIRTSEARWFDRVMGAVVNGDVCALPYDQLFVAELATCRALGADHLLLTMRDASGHPYRYAGLASREVDTIRIEFVDGTELTIRPVSQPVGETQAFIVYHPGPRGESVVALDADGNELQRVDLDE